MHKDLVLPSRLIVFFTLLIGLSLGLKTWHMTEQISYLKQRNADFQKEIESFLPQCMKEEDFIATAYEPSERSCGKWAKYNMTRTGTTPSKFRTVAVDPDVIPLGSLLYISGLGWFVAEDTGKDIRGNRIDLFFDDLDQALLFGRKKVTVHFYDDKCFQELMKEAKYSDSVKPSRQKDAT